MAYVFAMPNDVTALIYSFRDPLSWNGDKHHTTPLGRLFRDGDLYIERVPEAPYFQVVAGEICRIEPTVSGQESPYIVVWGRLQILYCYTTFVRIWLTALHIDL